MAMDIPAKRLVTRPTGLTSTEEKILRAARDLPFFTAEDITRLLSPKGSQRKLTIAPPEKAIRRC